MTSASEILSLLSMIYSDIIEPIFCVLYAFVLVRILTAKSINFRSEFYAFSIATGVAAITNVLLNWVLRLVDTRFQYFPNRGLFVTIDSMLSHICALAISIGKTLSVFARFTSIYLIHKKNIWSGRAIRICVAVMFGLPILSYCYFPAFSPVFSPTENGYGFFIGIANPGQLIAKAFATCGYLFFFTSTIPMCCLSVLKLRTERLNDRLGSDRHEKMLTFYAVVLTTSHMFKSVLQTIWFMALLLNKKDLQAAVAGLYLFPNTLSAFAEPVLLLITSPKLKKEVFSWKKRGASSSSVAISPMIISTARRISREGTTHNDVK